MSLSQWMGEPEKKGNGLFRILYETARRGNCEQDKPTMEEAKNLVNLLTGLQGIKVTKLLDPEGNEVKIPAHTRVPFKDLYKIEWGKVNI